MRNPKMKRVNDLYGKVIDDEALLNETIENCFSKSMINYQSDEKMMQAIGVANIRIGMASAHNFIEEKTKAQRELKMYLALGRKHRILLDVFWIMQTRGDENIVIGDYDIVDSLAYSMKKITDTGLDSVKKIVADGVRLNIFKRIKSKTDKRVTTYMINATDELIDAYIHWGNTHLGITGNLYMHTIQGAWEENVQEALFRKMGWWDWSESKLSIEQEIEMGNHFAEGAIKNVDKKISE